MRAREHIAQMVSAKGLPTYVQHGSVRQGEKNYFVLLFSTFSITKKCEENTSLVIIRCHHQVTQEDRQGDRMEKLPLFAYFNSARFYFST